MKAQPQAAPIDVGEVKILDVALIKGSIDNVRKTMDKAALEEMTASIRTQGVLQPLLVREVKDKSQPYEVVDGNRRLLCCTPAGVVKVPVIVRVMTDEQMAEAQLVTVLQREDLSGLDEAKAYKKLIDDHKYDVRAVAAKIGRTPGYVYACFRLLRLSPAWLKALAAGEVTEHVAAVVAALIDDHATQDKLMEQEGWELRNDRHDAASIRKVIQTRYMLDLKKAPWKLDDAQLVAAAGACGSCAKRSQAQGDLLGVSGEDNHCMDSACWAQKLKAHNVQLVAKLKADGREVLEGPAAEKAIKASGDSKSDLVVLDSSPHWWHYGGSLREALKGKKVPVVAVAVDSKGIMRELVERKAFLAAVPKQGGFGAQGAAGRTGPLSAKEKAERKARLLDLKATAAAWPKAHELVVQKLVAKGATLAMFKAFAHLITEHHLDFHNTRGPVERLQVKTSGGGYGSTVSKSLAGYLAKATSEKDVLRIIWHTALGPGLYDTHLTPHGEEAFKLAGVDWKALKAVEGKAITAARAAKEAAAAPATKRVKLVGAKPSKKKG